MWPPTMLARKQQLDLWRLPLWLRVNPSLVLFRARRCVLCLSTVKELTFPSPKRLRWAMASPAITSNRGSQVRAGVRVEVITVVWMLAEGGVALAAGFVARSVLLTSFGLDSLVELVSGTILLWRLQMEARGASLERVGLAESKAAWVSGGGLALLCVYVVATGATSLVLRLHPERSYVGIGLAVSAVLVMPLLVRSKRKIAAQIDSPALQADAACSVTCAYMAGALLVGLVLNAAFGWWWADSVGAFALLYWLWPETREAIESARTGRSSCGCHED